MSIPRIPILIIYVIFLGNTTLVCTSTTTGQVNSSEIKVLLSQLDSSKFAEREEATRRLIAYGDRSLPWLAEHYITASPEACWRIKKALEQIGILGNESTFLKSVGLVQILVGSNSREMNSQLERLKFEWLQKKTNDAINALRSAGATVDDISNRNVQVSSPATSQKPISKPPGKSLSDSEKRVLIAKIVKGTLNENRKQVLGDSDLKDSPDETIDALERQIAGRVIIRGGRAVNLGSRPGVIVKFDAKWKGNRSDFRQLENIRDLNRVVFVNQEIDRTKLEVLSSARRLRSLEFDSCELSGTAMAVVGLPEFTNELRFRNIDVSVALIDRISKLNVKSLLFDSCKFSVAAKKKMLAIPSLTFLELAKQTLDDGDLNRIANHKSLTALRLASTKFSFNGYKKLTRAKPNLHVDFAPTAFLGVRSVQRTNDLCEISDVISDSGAEDGGIKVGDVVKSVDGYKVDNFSDLRAHIALHKPGDVLNIKVERDSGTENLKVKLGDIGKAPLR